MTTPEEIIAAYQQVRRECPRITPWWSLVMTAERCGCTPLDVSEAIWDNAGEEDDE